MTETGSNSIQKIHNLVEGFVVPFRVGMKTEEPACKRQATETSWWETPETL